MRDELKQIDLEQARRNLQEDIDSSEERYRVFMKACDVFKRFSGKVITKRITTALNEEFPEYMVIYQRDSMLKRFTFWKPRGSYEDRFSIYVDQNGSGIMNVESVLDNNPSFVAVPAYVAELKDWLIGKNLIRLVSDWNAAVEELETLEKEMEDAKYSIRRVK